MKLFFSYFIDLLFFIGALLIVITSGCHKSNCNCPEVTAENCSCKNFILYSEGADSSSNHWWPSGWMGALTAMTCNTNCNVNPYSGSTCIKITYDPNNSVKWVGIYWLNQNSWNGPGNNIYKIYNICDSCKYKVTFWSRGVTDKEKIEFIVGGVESGNDSIDTLVSTGYITLSNSWQKYEIDIRNKNLTNLVGGFCFATNNIHNQTNNMIVFYLDDIIYEVTN